MFANKLMPQQGVAQDPLMQIFKGKVGEWLPDLKKAVDRFNAQDS